MCSNVHMTPQFNPLCIVELLAQCGWLSIRQLVFFHSAVNIYKTIQTTKPQCIYNKLSMGFPYNTRLAQSESVRIGSGFQCKLEITEKSYLNRATVCFNKLPSKLRQIRKLETFKKQLKAWVKEYTPPESRGEKGDVLPPLSFAWVEVYLLPQLNYILYNLQLRKKL